MKNREILCINDGRIFETAADAAKFYNIEPSRLCRVLKSDNATVKRLVFATLPPDCLPSDVRELRQKLLYNLLRVTNVTFDKDCIRYVTEYGEQELIFE